MDFSGVLGGDGWSLDAGSSSTASSESYRGDSTNLDGDYHDRRKINRSKTIITGSQNTGASNTVVIGGFVALGTALLYVAMRG